MISVEFAVATAASVLIAIVLVVRWARTSPQALLLIFPTYVVVSVTASVFYLDFNEIFISETGTVSYSSNASLRLLLFNVLIVGGVAFGFRVWSTVFDRPTTAVSPPALQQCNRILWLMIIIIGVSFANVFLSADVPYPGSGFNRQAFWESRIRFPFIRDFFGILLFFVPFVCGAVELYGRKLQEKRLINFARSVLVFYFAYLVIGGQVFHGLLLPATVVIALLIAEKVQSRATVLPVSRLLMIIAGGAAVVVTVYLSFESRALSQSFDNIWAAIVYRVLVLQGSTYWQTDSLWADDGATGSLESLLRGREFLIQSIMPDNLGDSYLEAGVNLQGALPATSLLSLGFWPTVLLCVAYGILLGLVTSLVWAMAVNGRVLLLLPSAYLWLWTQGAYSRASLEEIVSVKYLAFALIIVFALLTQESVRRSHRGPDSAKNSLHHRRLNDRQFRGGARSETDLNGHRGSTTSVARNAIERGGGPS